jgi:tagaturonate reductase
MFQFLPIEAALRRLNSQLDRIMPLLTPSGVVLGLLLGTRVTWMKPSVTILFAIITFIGGLGINSNAFFKVVKKPKAIFVFILGANVVMPLLTYAIAAMVFRNQQEIATGLILLMAIPTAITGYIWSGIYKGNGALSLTLILVSTRSHSHPLHGEPACQHISTDRHSRNDGIPCSDGGYSFNSRHSDQQRNQRQGE